MTAEQKQPVMNEEFFTKADLLLRDRVTVNRYEHSLSVSQMAALLAEIYGVDIMYARIAGLLHDWDKCLSTSTLRAIAKKYTDVPPSVRKHNAPTLHSFTAPWSLTQEFGALPPEILQAVESHTTGNIRMSDLDKIIFIADILEPGRDFADIADLREMIGSATLDELFFQTYKRTVLYLVQADKMVHPNTFKVYNALIKQRREAEDVSDAYVGASTEIDVKLPRGVAGEALDSEDDFEDDFEGDENDVVTSDSVSQDSAPASASKQDEVKDIPMQDVEVSHVSQKASAKPTYAPLRDFLQGEDSKQTIQPKTNSIHRLGRLEDLLHDAPAATPAKSQKTVTQTADKKNPRVGKLEDFLAQEADASTKKTTEESLAAKATKKAAKKAAAKKQPATLKKSLEEKKQSAKPMPQKDVQASEVREAPRKEPATQPTPPKKPKAAIPSSDTAAEKPAPKQAVKTHVQTEEKPDGKAQVSSASAQKKMDTTPLAGKEKPQQKKPAKAAIDVQGVVEDAPVLQATTSEDPLHAAQEKVAAQLRAVSNEEYAKEKKTAKKVDVSTQKAEKDAGIKEQMQGKKDAKAASVVTDKKDKPAKSKEDTPKKEQSKKKQDKAKVQEEPVETFLKDDGTFHSPRVLKIPNDSERPTLLNKIRRAKKEGDAKRKKSK